MTRRRSAAALLLTALLAAPPPTAVSGDSSRAETVAPAQGTSGAAAPRVDEPRRVLRDVLSDRRFRRARQSSWKDALMRRVREWLLKLFAMAAPAFGRRSLAQFFTWAASIGAVAVLLVWLTRFVFRRRGEQPPSVVAEAQHRQAAHVLAREAAELIRAGRLRDGARAAYAAALRRLEEDGTIRPDPARTPRETLRALRPSHRAAAPMAALTSAFERLWYGGRAAADGEAPLLLGLLRELQCLPSDRAN